MASKMLKKGGHESSQEILNAVQVSKEEDSRVKASTKSKRRSGATNIAQLWISLTKQTAISSASSRPN